MHFKKLVLFCVLFLYISTITSEEFLQEFLRKLTNSSTINEIEARKKKKSGKLILSILYGIIMIKSVLLPIALKTMAIIAGFSVILSTISLVVTTLLGYFQLVIKRQDSSIRIVHKHPQNWAKDDDNLSNYYTINPGDYQSTTVLLLIFVVEFVVEASSTIDRVCNQIYGQ